VVDREVIAATEQQWYLARKRMKQLGFQSAGIAVVLITVISVVASYLADSLFGGAVRYLATGALMLVAAVPLTGMVWYRIDRQQRISNRHMQDLRRQLKAAIDEVELQSGQRHEQVRRQDFERRLSSALEMADGEPQVVEVIERALASIAPDTASELLLADNSHAHLSRVAFHVADGSPDSATPGCGVDSPDRCPAARRSQVQRFSDSDALDACPQLRGRPQGRCSAMCFPVSVLGRTVGVLHTVAEPEPVADAAREQDLTTLADQLGARIGLLRMMAESQLQASTDSLTGLLNRRSMENRVRELRRGVAQVAVVVADLDHFKQLNDTYGHDTGDRALRLFANTLSSSLRQEDLLSRHGGEEFVAVLPGCTGAHASSALDKVRAKLRQAIAEQGLPSFTCSFGVVDTDGSDEYTALIARADAALFEAKHAGRDRVVVYDALTAVGEPESPSKPGLSLIVADD
jgi:diguanylate cyclase (GGDEF)-like protein